MKGTSCGEKITLQMSGSNDLTLQKAKHGGYYLHGNHSGYYSLEQSAVVLPRATGGGASLRIPPREFERRASAAVFPAPARAALSAWEPNTQEEA